MTASIAAHQLDLFDAQTRVVSRQPETLAHRDDPQSSYMAAEVCCRFWTKALRLFGQVTGNLVITKGRNNAEIRRLK